ncbi:magnetosome protein MamM [Fundidesulfovibrio magnetotacticus]|uniref:Magnetosome protein MamM n=1 Tax=Fundidesulfovibrio magnetotacticus TaxID=2730080 RepID=A0A6V8LPN7_9BACT|nr:cation diffusion facilitator family transporter [Fundidesulfovibrio magnetotacticus]GFK92298.1 magnetosome protein MamM [Fundidesulfovibrio magnetotacticus]
MKDSYCSVCMQKAAWYSIWASLLLALLQTLVGFVAGSTACLAIAIQSVSNIISSFSIIITQKVTAKEADEHFPFGYGKAEYIAAGFTCIIFAVVTLAITWIAVKQFMNAPAALMDFSPFLVAVASIIGNEILYHYLRCVAVHAKSPAIMANAMANRADSYAAGVVAVCSLGAWWGLPRLDAVATLVVALLIGRVLYKVFLDALAGLLDKSVNGAYEHKIYELAHGVPGVGLVNSLKTHRTGRKVKAELEILVERSKTVQEAYAIAEGVRTKLAASLADLDDVVVVFKTGKLGACCKSAGSSQPAGEMI